MCSKENWRCSFSGERRSSWWGGEGKRGEGERGSEWWTLDELQHESGLNDRLIISWRRSLHTLILSANEWTGFDMAGASDIKDLNFSHIFLTGCWTRTCPRFSNNESFIFNCNNLTSFESVFYMKTVKNRLFKKYLKRRKSRALFCLSHGWFYISANKYLKTAVQLVKELIYT